MAQELYSYIRVEKAGTLKIKSIYAIDFDGKHPLKYDILNIYSHTVHVHCC